MRSSALALLTITVALCAAPPARADLIDDAERVARRWSSRGARVTRRPPIFLEHSRPQSILPPRAPSPADQGASADAGCLTVLLLAPRTSEIIAELIEVDETRGPLDSLFRDTLPSGHPPIGPGSAEPRVRSSSGALTIVRCGAARAALRRIQVDLSGARSALEVIMAESREDLGDLREILPERAAGPIAPRGDPGRPIEPGPLPDRMLRAEKRARADGAESVTRSGMKASVAGTGELSLRMLEGCHRLDIMAEVPSVSPRRATDVDAEAKDAESERSLARDRADAADARLDFCLGETGVVNVPFQGAAGPVNVAVSDARWPIPRTIPPYWGARARGGFATALRRRGAPAPQEQPIFEVVGVQGETSASLSVEPGKCYLAAVALMRGDARGIRLAADLGSRAVRDEVVERAEGAAVAFCAAERDTSALIRVEARGNSPWWALAVWPM